jgi:hypothetical protein
MANLKPSVVIISNNWEYFKSLFVIIRYIRYYSFCSDSRYCICDRRQILDKALQAWQIGKKGRRKLVLSINPAYASASYSYPTAMIDQNGLSFHGLISG